MKIIITEPELTQIVRNHVLSTVQLQNGANIQIDFSATRGADGVTASIDIPYVGVTGLDLSSQAQQTKTEELIPPTTVKAEKVEKPLAAKTKAAGLSTATTEAAAPVTGDAPVGIFAAAKAEADAAVASSSVAEETTASDTAAAVEGSAQEDAAPAPSAAAGVSLFP